MKLVIFLLMSIFIGFAQAGSLSGNIIDNNTREALPGVTVSIKGTSLKASTNLKGFYNIENVPVGLYTVEFSYIGYENYIARQVHIKKNQVTKLNVEMELDLSSIEDAEVSAPHEFFSVSNLRLKNHVHIRGGRGHQFPANYNTEEYGHIVENKVYETIKEPLSTFSIDVDRASYTNTRRFLNQGNLPPKDAVRIEEFINYFSYDYLAPKGNEPFSVFTELSACAWNPTKQLLHIGIKGKEIEKSEMKASNLVFLLDVSGSMNMPDKLPLLKKAFRLLTHQLSEKDRISIVVYAGNAGLVLEPTNGNNPQKILEAIENLEAGGSTAGGAGIELAYKTAKENFIKGGINRVILATDGDFNVGISGKGELIRLIEEKRTEGIFLTVLGFGTGNLKDEKMEQLANKGNGNYAYIDNFLEAKKVLVNEIGGTLQTIAKDVKFQVEFNPAKIKNYRLIGYENRVMANQDFDDDTKDAGELGAGHTVTALYEIELTSAEETGTHELKYQETKIKGSALKTNEFLTVNIRYKSPEGTESKRLSFPVTKQTTPENCSENFRFSAAVAEFGMLLRGSEYKSNASFDHVISVAKSAKSKDHFGYRGEFINLVETAKLLHKSQEH